MNTTRFARLIALAHLLALLAACGGGGDDGSGDGDQMRINPPHCSASAPSCT